MRKLGLIIAVVLMLAALVVPVSAQDQTIVEIASGDENFSTLVMAVLAADPSIAEALGGEGELTVFAPTNAAFADLLATLDLTAEELLAETEIMNQVLVAQKKAEANMITRREETASTRSMLNTARLMEDNAMVWKIKEMEFVEKIADKVSNISLSGTSGVVEQLKEIFSTAR